MSTLKEQLIRLGALSPDAVTQEKSSSFYSNTPSTSASHSSTSRPSNSRNSNSRNSNSRTSNPRNPNSRNSNPRNSNSRNSNPRHRTHPRSQRARTQSLEMTQGKELLPEERKKEIKKLFTQARMPFPPTGIKRFYFELKNGEIDFIEMDHSDFQAFSNAEFSIVEDPKGRLCVLNQQALLELYALDPEWVPKSV